MTAQLKRKFTISIVFQHEKNERSSIRFDLLVGDSIEWNHLAGNWITERAGEHSQLLIDFVPLRTAGQFACGFCLISIQLFSRQLLCFFFAVESFSLNYLEGAKLELTAVEPARE